VKELIYPHSFLPGLEQYGEQEGIIDGGYRSTWNTHGERVSRLCHALRARLGVGSGDNRHPEERPKL